MKTGNIFELAEVVRNLAVRNNEKGLSTGEKQMFVKAKKILASELMYAKDMDEERGCGLARRRPVEGGAAEAEVTSEAEGPRRQPRVPEPPGGSGVTAGATWALLVAAGAGERLGIDRPKAFAVLGGRPLLAESLDRLDRCALGRRDRRRRPAGMGGAVDPSLRGARGDEGGRLRRRRVRPAPSRSGSRSPRWRTRRSSCSCTTPRDPSRRRGRRARARPARGRVRRRRARRCRSRTRSSGSRAAWSRRRSRARASSPRRRRRRSSRRRCAARSRATSTDATDCASLVERAGGRVAVVEGDRRLLKVTTPEDLALVESWL